jgi:threonine/homoserine/homoserine lactone efflux protein
MASIVKQVSDPDLLEPQMLSPDLLAALVAFAFVTSVTPGPNNMMLLASGVNHGFRRTIPHMLGISIGFGGMIIAVGMGIGQIFTRYPQTYLALKIVSIIYLLWLAWKIATTGPLANDGVAGTGQPMSFLGACAFQWVNPKAWTMALGAISAYTVAADYAKSLIIVGLVFTLVNLPTVSLWTLFGSVLRRWLTEPRKVRIFNIAMALLLIASMVPIIMGMSLQ